MVDVMAMTLRLSEELDAALRETAAREGRSLHEVVVLALEDYTSKREKKRDALIARVMSEDSEALERLGSV